METKNITSTLEAATGIGFDIDADLSWNRATHEALAGFLVLCVEPGIGPDGATILYGYYPENNPDKLYAIAVYPDEEYGVLIYDKAQLPRKV